MIRITLEPRCLKCGELRVLDATLPFKSADGLHKYRAGSITCSHAAVCKFMGGMPSISEIVDGYASSRGGE